MFYKEYFTTKRDWIEVQDYYHDKHWKEMFSQYLQGEVFKGGQILKGSILEENIGEI